VSERTFGTLKIRLEDEVAWLDLDHGKANEMGKAEIGAFEGLCGWLEAGSARVLVTSSRRVSGKGTPIFISGANVTPGYEGNPDANAKSFFEAEGHRWFRTGDQGALDGDGYLHLTGRLKEIINRGGEKISPLEVDGVLMDHPAIAPVVAFAVPHPKLGEEVADAVRI